VLWDDAADAAFEKLALNACECGNVFEVLREQLMEREELQARMRRLVAEHSTEGQAALDRLGGADLLLLLSAKQHHLGEVSQRLATGKDDPMVCWKLKGILEAHVREVGQELDRKGISRGR
jgi:hypothetical protein